MSSRCCVCYSRRRTNRKSENYFHLIPRFHYELRQKWLAFIKLHATPDEVTEIESKPQNYFYVCSDHFESKDYGFGKTGKRYLRRTAVPSHLHPPVHPDSIADYHKLFHSYCKNDENPYNQNKQDNQVQPDIPDIVEVIEEDLSSSRTVTASEGSDANEDTSATVSAATSPGIEPVPRPFFEMQVCSCRTKTRKRRIAYPGDIRASDFSGLESTHIKMLKNTIVRKTRLLRAERRRNQRLRIKIAALLCR